MNFDDEDGQGFEDFDEMFEGQPGYEEDFANEDDPAGSGDPDEEDDLVPQPGGLGGLGGLGGFAGLAAPARPAIDWTMVKIEADATVRRHLREKSDLRVKLFKGTLLTVIELHFKNDEDRVKNYLLNVVRREALRVPEVAFDDEMFDNVLVHGTAAATGHHARLCNCGPRFLLDDGTTETCTQCGTTRASAGAHKVTFDDIMTKSSQGASYTMLNGRKVYLKSATGVVAILNSTKDLVRDFDLLSDVDSDRVEDVVRELMAMRASTSGRKIRKDTLKIVIRNFPGKFEDRLSVYRGMCHFRVTKKAYPEIFAYAAGMGSEMHKAFSVSSEIENAGWWTRRHVGMYRKVFGGVAAHAATVGPLAIHRGSPTHKLTAGIVYHVVQELRPDRTGDYTDIVETYFDVGRADLQKIRKAIIDAGIGPKPKKARRFAPLGRLGRLGKF